MTELVAYLVGMIVTGGLLGVAFADNRIEGPLIRVLGTLLWPAALPLLASWMVGDRIAKWRDDRAARRRALAERVVTPAPLAESRTYREVTR